MTDVDAMIARIQNLQIDYCAMDKRYQGFMEMHDAACLENKGAEVDGYRQQLHILLDQMLDTRATIQMLVRQAGTLPPRYR